MPSRFTSRWRVLVLAGLAAVVCSIVWMAFRSSAPNVHPPGASPKVMLASGRNLTVWWDPPGSQSESHSGSNMHPADYAGPDSCRECHPKNHQSWSSHPHQGMNALANDGTVRGDFSGASISYRGGRASFEKRDGHFRMKLERDGTTREYQIHQTIGVRLQQYYVGTLVAGPESPNHIFRTTDHVLPFGYLLDRKEWSLVVHIGPERADEERPDPFEPPDSGPYFASYAAGCNYCHTTFPLGDLFVRRSRQMGEHAPRSMDWGARGYLEESRPAEFRGFAELIAGGKLARQPNLDWEAKPYAVTLGVSCEACHLGSKQHVASGGKTLPSFFPASPHLSVQGAPETGRTHDNVNWACGRCHTGTRPSFAAGMSTWNSVEYDDAMRGSCYTQLRCIDCHEPHTAIGPKWTAPPERDDAVCLKCHSQYRAAEVRSAHTHHPAGSPGDRCLNCHMPRINEGINDVVRTHMIYSPTRADMLQANHPNACNLCHTDQPLPWTLARLREWYGKPTTALSGSLSNEPLGLGWLQSRNASVRLVAASAMMRENDRRMLPHLIDALDDSHLLNRQFATKGLESMFNTKLADLGYRFYQTRDERRAPLESIRRKLTPTSP